MRTRQGFYIFLGGIIGFCLALLTIPEIASVRAQGRPTGGSLEIGSQVIRIGMPKEQAITMLSKGFIVEDSGEVVNGNQFWFVRDKADRVKIVGGLQFKNNRVVVVTRDWDEIESDTRTTVFLKSFHSAFQHLIGQNITRIYAQATMTHKPGSEHYQLDFHTQEGTITFVSDESTLPNGSPYRSATIEESVPGL